MDRKQALWVTALFALLTLATACSEAPQERSELAPDFTLESVDGDPVRLSQYRGKVVLLDFWATWCPPCRAAFPHLTELQEEHGDEGFVILSMNMDMNPEDVTEFLSRTDLNFPVLKVDDDVRAAYGGVSSIPQTFIIDRMGRIQKKFLGYDREIASKIDATVQSLLKREGT